MGNQTVTLWANTAYTGTTSIANGVLALGRYGDISTSSGVFLTSGTAVFDISQAGDSKVKAIAAVAGSTVALGSHDLVVLDAGTSRIAGSLVDGGLGGGVGGGLVMAGRGVLQLAGIQGYTGATRVEAGTLGLDAASLASRSVSVAAGARLTGNGTLAGQVSNDGVIRAEDGTLTISGDVTGAGSIVVGTGAVLSITGATSQTITLEGNGILRVADPASFTGTLVGFGPGNAIDLVGVVSPEPVVLGDDGSPDHHGQRQDPGADQGRRGLRDWRVHARRRRPRRHAGQAVVGAASGAVRQPLGRQLPGRRPSGGDLGQRRPATITAAHGEKQTQAIAIPARSIRVR